MALKDETSIAASTVTSTGPTPAGRPFRLGPLYFTVPLGNFVLYALWTVVPGFLLPIKVQQLTGTTDVGALGLASTLGAVTATLGNPAFGQFSDRTRSRFGRRPVPCWARSPCCCSPPPPRSPCWASPTVPPAWSSTVSRRR
ncbi:hypothetical protein [Streptomyces atratus]